MNNLWLQLRGSVRKFTEISLQDMSYSWWVNPISIYKYGFNWFSCIDLNGDRQIYKFNLEGGSLNSQAFNDVVDEHSTAAILPLSDGTVLIIFSGHETPTVQFFKISQVTMQITQSVDNVFSNGSYSYAQLIDSNDKVFCLSRNSLVKWSLAISNDLGNSFGSEVDFITRNPAINKQFYISTQKTGDNNIRIGCYNHPFSGSNNVLNYLELNTFTGVVSSLGVTITNLYSNFSTIQASALMPIYTLADAKDGMDRFRFLGNLSSKGDFTYFLIAEFLESENEDYRSGWYRMVKVNNTDYTTSIIDIIPHGKDGNWSYFGGAYFVQSENGEWNNEIILSREENEIWYCERYEFTGSQFLLKELIDTVASGSTDNSGLSIHRPQPPYNSDKFGAKLSYQKGDYFEGYVNWDNEIIIK